MTNKHIMMFAIGIIATASIAMIPAFAANMGVQLTVEEGFTNTLMYAEYCGTGMCYAYIYTDTVSELGEFIWGTSGNECTVNSTITRNGTATLEIDSYTIQDILFLQILKVAISSFLIVQISKDYPLQLSQS